jgi:hypothetical protein
MRRHLHRLARGLFDRVERAIEPVTRGLWPDFSMYHPIFTAAPEAAIYGALVPP